MSDVEMVPVDWAAERAKYDAQPASGAVELLRAAAARCRLLDSAATPGPWETGTYYQLAGVAEDLFGPGRCTFCVDPDAGPIVWQGRTDINGTVRLAHQHRVPTYLGVDTIWAQPRGRDGGMRFLVAGEDDIDIRDLRYMAAFRAVAAPLADLLATCADPVDDEVRNIDELLVAVARALLPPTTAEDEPR